MISIDQLNVFWACLVTNALTIEERELAFVWLENTRGSTLVILLQIFIQMYFV